MPSYNFMNEETGEVERHIMPYKEIESFLKENPHLKKTLSKPDFISGTTVHGGKLPEAFKDRLRLAKRNNPTSKGLDHLI